MFVCRVCVEKNVYLEVRLNTQLLHQCIENFVFEKKIYPSEVWSVVILLHSNLCSTMYKKLKPNYPTECAIFWILLT